MTNVRSLHARRRRSAGPLAVALMLAAAGFVLALTVGAALHRQAEAVATEAPATASSDVPAVSAVTETRPRRVLLSAVPQLPALHGVKERKAKKAKRKPAVRPVAPPRAAAPPRVAAPPAPVTRRAAQPPPARVVPRVVAPPRRPVAPPAPPRKKSPSFVGKGFDSSG